MWITIKGRRAVEINSQSVKQVLSMYPEERLPERGVFKDAFDSDSIELQSLKEESDKIIIPWQFFLLDQRNLQEELTHIDKMRSDKISEKLLAKRKGGGEVTSKRIIDRLIRLQNFVSENSSLSANKFCGSLINRGDKEAVAEILSHFNIDTDKFRGYSRKMDALKYLIGRVEAKDVNVSQGVLTNKILPNWRVVQNNVYKSTSGFVIKDDKIPFVFLPSEVNPEETDGRQIYTLIYLIAVIGLNQYDFSLGKDFKVEVLEAKGKSARVHRITSELLLPRVETEKLRGGKITVQVRDELSSLYKITPTAVLVTLMIRGHFSSKKEYEALLPVDYVPPKVKDSRYAPNIETSVMKFCGKYPFDFINAALKGGTLKNIQAQYLLFGAVSKKAFKKYRTNLKI